MLVRGRGAYRDIYSFGVISVVRDCWGCSLIETTKKQEERQGFFINFGSKHFDVIQGDKRVGRAYLEFKKEVRNSLRLRVQLYGRQRSGKINKWKIIERYTVRLSLEAMKTLIYEVENRTGPISVSHKRWRPEVR